MSRVRQKNHERSIEWKRHARNADVLQFPDRKPKAREVPLGGCESTREIGNDPEVCTFGRSLTIKENRDDRGSGDLLGQKLRVARSYKSLESFPVRLRLAVRRRLSKLPNARLRPGDRYKESEPERNPPKPESDHEPPPFSLESKDFSRAAFDPARTNLHLAL